MLEPARRVAFAVAVLFAAVVGTMAPTLASAQLPDLRVPASEPKYTAIVVDARSGEVLYAKRADSPRYPASITKIMTMYLAFEALSTGKIHGTDMITVSSHAAAQAPSKLGLRPGDQISVDDCLHAIAVKSANDMAVAMAEYLGGSEPRFAALMTLRAQDLGMANTRYVNASGLPDTRQISTARDIAILSRSVMRDFPQYYGYFSQETFTFRGQSMNNHNGLLGKMPGVDGLKTGFTSAAGFNLAASAVRGGNRLIAVVMGGTSGAARNANVADLLLTGFDVMDRRGRGENIQVAQNLFEAAPSSTTLASMRPEASEGDEDAIDVVLTRNTAGANQPVQLSSTFSGAQAQGGASRPVLMADLGMRSGGPSAMPAAIQRAHESHSWIVQVGAFHSRREARQQVETVARQFGAVFDDAEGDVDPAAGGFRARFSGFTESAARQACATVQASGIACAVTPGG